MLLVSKVVEMGQECFKTLEEMDRSKTTTTTQVIIWSSHHRVIEAMRVRTLAVPDLIILLMILQKTNLEIIMIYRTQEEFHKTIHNHYYKFNPSNDRIQNRHLINQPKFFFHEQIDQTILINIGLRLIHSVASSKKKV